MHISEKPFSKDGCGWGDKSGSRPILPNKTINSIVKKAITALHLQMNSSCICSISNDQIPVSLVAYQPQPVFV